MEDFAEADVNTDVNNINSGKRAGSKNQDQTMESNSFDGVDGNLSDTSSEHTIDRAGNRIKKNFANDEERK